MELKKEIRDIIIFYQRRLKSQKGLISFCEFEKREVVVEEDGRKKNKTVGCRVINRWRIKKYGNFQRRTEEDCSLYSCLC